MRDSGLRMVFLGAESGSDETLARMNKGGTATAAKTLEIAAKMARYGIVPEMSFVIGNPPDPEARRGEHAWIHPPGQGGSTPRPRSSSTLYTPVPLAGELYDQAKAEGFAFPETLEEWIGAGVAGVRCSGAARPCPGSHDPLRRRLRDFEWVLNARTPPSPTPG